MPTTKRAKAARPSPRYRLRYQLAWNHDVCRGVVAVFLRAVLGLPRARACDTGVADGRGGAVAVIQRFGGSLNLNLHVHALVLDGVFTRNPAGALTSHPTRRLTALDVEEVLAISGTTECRAIGMRSLTFGSPWASSGTACSHAGVRGDASRGNE